MCRQKRQPCMLIFCDMIFYICAFFLYLTLFIRVHIMSWMGWTKNGIEILFCVTRKLHTNEHAFILFAFFVCRILIWKRKATPFGIYARKMRIAEQWQAQQQQRNDIVYTEKRLMNRFCCSTFFFFFTFFVNSGNKKFGKWYDVSRWIMMSTYYGTAHLIQPNAHRHTEDSMFFFFLFLLLVCWRVAKLWKAPLFRRQSGSCNNNSTPKLIPCHPR